MVLNIQTIQFSPSCATRLEGKAESHPGTPRVGRGRQKAGWLLCLRYQ
uniref:Uncharacterized protein n=1 Tax=Rhizophora mucronata TaxID=61149 RepID=A0A2P2P0Y4_RHIMU